MKTTQDERDELRKRAEQWHGRTLYSDVPHGLLLRLLDDADYIARVRIVDDPNDCAKPDRDALDRVAKFFDGWPGSRKTEGQK